MNAHIFAEGSNTTDEDRTLPAQNYFQGLFGMVTGLSEDLSASTDTTLHILSGEFGMVRGDQSVDRAAKLADNDLELDEAAQTELLEAAKEADVMVILLSTATFEETAGEVWSELVEAAKPDSIWCIGAAQSTLDSLDFGPLEGKDCSVITYQRVGVARLDTDSREELLEAVSQKAVE